MTCSRLIATALTVITCLMLALAATALADDTTAPSAPTDQAHEPEHAEADDAHGADQHAAPHEAESHDRAAGVNPWWILPFGLLLGFIALAPLIAPKWWHHQFGWVAFLFFLIGFGYYAVVRGWGSLGEDWDAWMHNMHHWFTEMQEYVSFICLLFALFVISGGIVIHVSRRATPLANCTLLLTGAVIANIFGTTGAAMLLIRPYIRINRNHIKPYHIVFFIFLVANVGGCLTPIGDPPLFLGYLRGVPFWWVFEHCWQPWLMGALILLLIFFVVDKLDHSKAERIGDPEHDTGPAVRITGIHNFLFILLVLVAVFRPSIFAAIDAFGDGGFSLDALIGLVFSRELLMVTSAIVSKIVTRRGIYEQNEFTWFPIKEVAILFVAIFSCMVPALQWLDANSERLPLKSPGKYYFITGTLSSVLDNAPTYLVFLQTQTAAAADADPKHLLAATTALDEMGEQETLDIPQSVSDPAVRATLRTLTTHHAAKVQNGTVGESDLRVAYMISQEGQRRMNGHPLVSFLIAISVGAVFFGACTYIGNAPNFMVKSIAESAGISMPSFIGYVVKYSLPILIPVYVLVWLVFFFRTG